MFAALGKALLREYRTRRMARFTVWVLAYGAALWSVEQLSSGAPAALWYLFWLAAIPLVIGLVNAIFLTPLYRAEWQGQAALQAQPAAGDD